MTPLLDPTASGKKARPRSPSEPLLAGPGRSLRVDDRDELRPERRARQPPRAADLPEHT